MPSLIFDHLFLWIAAFIAVSVVWFLAGMLRVIFFHPSVIFDLETAAEQAWLFECKFGVIYQGKVGFSCDDDEREFRRLRSIFRSSLVRVVACVGPLAFFPILNGWAPSALHLLFGRSFLV